MAHRLFAGSLPAPFWFFVLNVLISPRSIVGDDRCRFMPRTNHQADSNPALCCRHSHTSPRLRKGVSPRYECIVRAAPIGSPGTRSVVYCAQYFPEDCANLEAYLK